MRFMPLLLGLFLASPAVAQTEPVPSFLGEAYVQPSNFSLSDTYTFDDEFAAEHGAEPPVPFRISVPRRDGVEVNSRLQPDGGAFVGFTFLSEPAEGFESLFLEVLQFTAATIPMMENEPDPVQARVAVAANLLEQQVYPTNFANAPEAELVTIEQIELGTVPYAVQLIARYYDPEYEDRMMVRAVILIHPDQPESLLALAQINLDVIPVRDGATLAETSTGRTLSSFEFR